MVTSILPVILPLDPKRHDQSAPSDLKPPLRSQVSASEESLCPTHLERNCAQQVTDYRPLQINESPLYRTSLREAHSLHVYLRSPDTERLTKGDWTLLLPRLVRLVVRVWCHHATEPWVASLSHAMCILQPNKT